MFKDDVFSYVLVIYHWIMYIYIYSLDFGWVSG